MYKLINNLKSSNEAIFSICCTLFNEEKNIVELVNEIEKISLILKIKKVILLDNGSTDSTKKKLLETTCNKSIFFIISNKKNSNYTDGVKRLLSETIGENILIFHSDLQYKPFYFIKNNLNKIKYNDYKSSFIITFRKNRYFLEEIISKLFRLVSRMTLGLKPMDYNAQPKFFFNNVDLKIFERIDGFSADLAICNHLNNLKFHSIDISEDRNHNAMSSWNFGLFSKIKLSINYLKNIFIILLVRRKLP